ncbi:MAG: hypothetical protein ACRDTE_13795 [Pseudonocardiaceae bacterium]
MCAAAHLDEKFCDEAIAEFLVEPVRAIPPSPGVDSAAVLREAVAAQTRRRIRDGVLLALLVVFVFANITVAFFWAVLVAVAAVLMALVRNRRAIASALVAAGTRGDWHLLMRARGWLTAGAGINRPILALVVIGFLAVVGVPFFLLASVLGSAIDPSLGAPAISELIPGSTWLTVVLGLLMLVVLAVDEFTVARLMSSSFRRGRFDPDARRAASEWERLARSLGHDSFRAGLHRVARAEEGSLPAGQADVIVYRGYTPFIGAGDKVAHHVIALPLEPSEDDNDDEPVPVSVNDLHRHVAEALAALRSPSSLGPERRLEGLRHREQVLVPADRLLINQLTRMQPAVLPDLSHPPVTQLPLAAARALAENPLEWARYYSCFRVESWDRDLVTSCYLHLGTDQRMLYLEWTYCVLLPVSERYRSIDRVREWRPFVGSLVEWVVLPVSLFQRFRSAFRRHVPLSQRPGELVPDRYGSAQSLREIAADVDAQTYFQDADIERYVNVLDSALVRAVGQYLEERGYSVVEFTRMAVGNNFNIFGDVIGSAVGKNSKVGDVRVNAARPGAKGSK